MEKTVSTLDWRPIATAPANADLQLSVYENGEYHALVFPCRRDGSGWRDVRANRPMPLGPTHWRVGSRAVIPICRYRVIFFKTLLGIDGQESRLRGR
jgi:hypothetical protein